MHQIDSGLKRGYKERDLIDAISYSISLQSSLRSYFETLRELSLAKLRKILQVHYCKKTTSEQSNLGTKVSTASVNLEERERKSRTKRRYM